MKQKKKKDENIAARKAREEAADATSMIARSTQKTIAKVGASIGTKADAVLVPLPKTAPNVANIENRKQSDSHDGNNKKARKFDTRGAAQGASAGPAAAAAATEQSDRQHDGDKRAPEKAKKVAAGAGGAAVDAMQKAAMIVPASRAVGAAISGEKQSATKKKVQLKIGRGGKLQGDNNATKEANRRVVDIGRAQVEQHAGVPIMRYNLRHPIGPRPPSLKEQKKMRDEKKKLLKTMRDELGVLLPDIDSEIVVAQERVHWDRSMKDGDGARVTEKILEAAAFNEDFDEEKDDDGVLEERKKQLFKAKQEMQKLLNEYYGHAYISPSLRTFFEKYEIDMLDVDDPLYCPDEIRGLCYETEQEDKEDPKFTVYCGPQEKETIIKGCRMEQLKPYLSEGYLYSCQLRGELAKAKGPYQERYLIPIGDSNLDKAPDDCLCKFGSNGRSLSPLPFQQNDKAFCLGYCLANVLFYLKLDKSAQKLADNANRLSILDARRQLAEVSNIVQLSAKGIGTISLEEVKRMLDGIPKQKTIEMLMQYDLHRIGSCEVGEFVLTLGDGKYHAV
ncbi:unnamed protein product [Cylindrotheca closterium]|uniref:Uncharacterized protein n=1 Tax=Cylindrotheca closterium TaxID=2856 RepID=A0AAD2FS00_9STRA|nr:unnamed protein product [Cylindrotheca closterium]